MFFANWLRRAQHTLQGIKSRRRRASSMPIASEVLESRRVPTTPFSASVAPAHIEASLSNGVLTIEGTNRNDKIVLQQVGGQISIEGVRINVNGHIVKEVVASEIQRIRINGLNGDDRIVFRGAGGRREAITINAWIDGGAGDDTIFSGDGNDCIRGGGIGNSRFGNIVRDDDFIRGGGGNDSMYGEVGNDTLDGGSGDDWLDGDSELVNETVNKYNGRDVLRGSAGSDTLSGGFGDDVIDGGTGDDRLVEASNVNITLSTSRMAGVGADRLRSIEQAELVGGDSANRLDAGAFRGSVTLIGEGGDDTLVGGSRNDLLIGGWMNNVVLVDDMVFTPGEFGFLAGTDVVDGGGGNDELRAGFGNGHLQVVGEPFQG